MSMIFSAPSPRVIYDQEDIVRQLREMGLQNGDTVLVRVDFSRIGRVRKPADRVLVASLLEAIGTTGTLVAVTHSPVQWIFRRDSSYVYEPARAPCVTGRFASTVLQWEGVVRSQHPTCSMAAIGPRARDLLARHDHTATTHEPIKHLLAADGKLLNVGCALNSPGFSTVHYTYEVLGLAERSLLSGLLGCYFKHGDRVEWFRQNDVPGCSLGFHKFFPLYAAKDVLKTGQVGHAEATLIRAADAFAIEREAVANAPAFSLCDNPHCFSCRGTKYFNWPEMLPFFTLRAPMKLLRRLTRG